MVRIRPTILAELFTNLAAGWFGLLLITPSAIASESPFVTVVHIIRALLAGLASLVFAEKLTRMNEA